MNVYIVKSFGPEGYLNCKVFSTHEKAEEYQKLISVHCEGLEDEWVEIESMTLE
jgi:hypothetical protein